MNTNTDIPPVAKSKRSGFLDEAVLSFSSKLFEKPLLGYTYSIIFNLFYIYYWRKHTNIFSIIIFSIMYFIIVKIIQIKLFQK